jgi:hypothetical protein
MPDNSKRGGVTAHVKRIAENNERVTSLVLSEKQLLELIAVATVALREKSHQKDGYHLVVWKDRPAAQCQNRPPCEGGSKAAIVLARR